MNTSTHSSIQPVETDSFFVVENDDGAMEFWYDFSPFVDVSPFLPVNISRVDNHLFVSFLEENSPILCRKFSDIQDDVWEGLVQSGVVVVVCGPSGVISRRPACLA